MDRKAKDRYLYKTYGITIEDYERMFEAQDHRCAICLNVPKLKMLNVDHRHVKNYKDLPACEKKKEVRGLLCFFCNKYLMGAVEHYKNPRDILFRLNGYCQAHSIKND